MISTPMTISEHHDVREGPRILVCPLCGASFTCSRSPSCWCVSRKVPEEVRLWLADRYQDCVCPACLDRLIRKHEDGGITQ